MKGNFERFNILSTTYKTVGQHPIQVNVLVPRDASAERSPVILRFHGGGYVTGDSLHVDWFPLWQAELALVHKAIIVCPNYRLLPESTGNDIMQDIDDFWTWMKDELTSFIQLSCPGVTPDLRYIMTSGESAGGYLSVQVAMNHPHDVSSCIAEFPSLHLESSNFTERRKSPKVPLDVVEKHIAALKGNEVVSSDPSISRFPLIMSMTENGAFLKYFGQDERLFPFQRLKNGAAMPPLFIIHGEDDDIVPVEGSRSFVSLLREKHPNSSVRLSTAPGGHGFHEDYHMDHPSLEDGLAFAIAAWFKGRNH